VQRRSLEAELADVASLSEPVRRALYLYVSAQPEPVSRDQAANAIGITRALAAFHLDRLVEEGLLQATYRRVSGRTGPGAGRPAKVYRRSGREVQVSLPPRNLELAARVLARTVERFQEGEPDALRTSARELGAALGKEARRRAGHHAAAGRRVESLVEILGEQGFEPFRGEGNEVRLRNCPFDPLARDHRSAVCGMNLEVMRGALQAATPTGLEAVADPDPETCCVMLRPAQAAAPTL
jgi:predicted ArsR family transcriptional regulator